MEDSIVSLDKPMIHAEIDPSRGALATRLVMRGREILYLDRESLLDRSKNVRGGIPILFPFASPLKDGILEASGTKIGQHGFARNENWSVDEQTPSSLKLTMELSQSSRDAFPWPMNVHATFNVEVDSFVTGLVVHNMGDRPLPAAPGWHPYFVCPRDRKHEVRVNLPGFDHSRFVNDAEFNFGVPIDEETPLIGISIPSVGTIDLLFSPEMKHLQFWTLPGKDFICIEPFWGPPNVINTPARMEVPPGKAKGLFMGIEFVSTSMNGFQDDSIEK